MEVPIWQVDAFTGQPFGGNPAAVCLLDTGLLPLPDGIRQKIAAEMNLSETAFVEPVEAESSSGAGQEHFVAAARFKLRWFTPAVEVPLCGHATLASAAVIFLERHNVNEAIEFETLSGVLTVRRGQRGGSMVLEMDLPARAPSDPLPAPLQPQPAAAAESIAASVTAVTGEAAAKLDRTTGLGALLHACTGGLPVETVQYNAALKYLLVVLRDSCSQADLEAVQPDAAAMSRAVGPAHMTGVIVTAAGSGGYSFCCRFFGPWVGISEDPATGSAFAVAGPYWAARLGKSSLFARQCSPRGADVWVDVDAAQQQQEEGGGSGQVKVSGQGVVVLRGVLLLPRA